MMIETLPLDTDPAKALDMLEEVADKEGVHMFKLPDGRVIQVMSYEKYGKKVDPNG